MIRYRAPVAILWQMAVLLCLLIPSSPVRADTLAGASLATPSNATHITAQLIAEAPAAPGTTTTLAIAMSPQAGWHGYWLNPGDAGYAMRLTWHLPAGAQVGTPAYPVPQTLVLAGLMNHVYERDYAVLVPFTVPANARPGAPLAVSLEAEWLACSAQICVPEKTVLAGWVQVAEPNAPAPHDPRFAAWRAALPAPLGATAHFATDGQTIRLAIPFPASAAIPAPHLFIAQDRLVDYAAPQGFARDGDTLVVTLHRPTGMLAPLSSTISGVLALNKEGNGIAIDATAGTVPANGVPIVPAGTAPALPTLPLLLLAALAGGLILNVMPCVFPILSLKALSLARAGGNEAEARAEGLAYTAGVVLACVALGGLLLVLRAGGEQVGWAFQLQEPGVIAALLALAVAITANLLGVYELSVPGFAQTATGSGAKGAFATGLLAAFVATPCTGPFMASAMGAALLLPVVPALALFATLGIGIALPFLAIAFIASLRRLMPRPGNWMVWFRRIMAVPMGLTALALVWLASRIGGWSFAGASVVVALVLLALLVVAGREQRRGLAMARGIWAGLAVLVVGAVVLLPRSVHRPDAETADVLPSLPYSDAALAKALASGHPVFAFFTADWCLTCKVNERLAIERTETRDAFARANVTVLEGDWTRRDPAITAYLTAHGAAGVPLYVWYPGGGGAARVLPQVLTPALLEGLPAGK